MVTHALPCVSTKVMYSVLSKSLYCLRATSTSMFLCVCIFSNVVVGLSNSKKASYVFLCRDETNVMVGIFYMVYELLWFVPMISHGLNYISLLCGFYTSILE